MNRIVLALVLATAVVAGCSGDEVGDDDTVSLQIVSPAPGATFERTTLDNLGALVATVPFEVGVTGAPARIGLSIGPTAVGNLAADNTAAPTIKVVGPAMLIATAYDAADQPLATAEVAVTIVDPTLADCHAWLDLYGVQYTTGPDRMGVADPVTAMMPINGMPFRSSSTLRTTMFADCSLIRSLATAASTWRARGIVEVTDLGVYNYRCINSAGTPPNCTIGLSEHSFGNAIDLASFNDGNGQTYSVNNDWVIDPNSEETCEAPTVAGKDQFLHEMICELKNAHVWNIVLTPNYNALHRDHFHVDLTAGSDFIERRVDDPGIVDTHAHELAH